MRRSFWSIIKGLDKSQYNPGNQPEKQTRANDTKVDVFKTTSPTLMSWGGFRC